MTSHALISKIHRTLSSNQIINVMIINVILLIKLSVKIFSFTAHYLLLTYDKNIDRLFFCCNPFTSFTLFEGTGVCSIVSRKNWIDNQTSIKKLGEPSLMQQCSTLFLPKNLWGWSTFNTTAYNPGSTSNNTLFRVHLSKSCCWKKQHWFDK